MTYLWIVALSLLGAACRMQEVDSGGPEPSSPRSGEARVRAVHPPAEGDVAPIVRGEYEHARGSGRDLVVYVGATWCEPCEKFRHAVETGQLDARFPKLTLLEFDVDKDSARLHAAGYKGVYIPMLALPKPDGTASGKQVEGGIKGEGAVDVVSDKLKTLLAQN